MDLATVDHVLTTTRSVRMRLDLRRPVERQVIEQCIDIAALITAPATCGHSVYGAQSSNALFCHS